VASDQGNPRAAGRRSAAVEYGVLPAVRGFVRRRAGLAWTRLRYPRIEFGDGCDVRRGTHFLVARGTTVRFGAGCVLDHGLVVESRGALEVGDRTVFGHHCTIASDQRVSIGRDCLLAEMVSIRDHDHAFDSTDVAIIDQGRSSAPVVIGDNVWIGAKATVTKGVTIGSNSVVGAHAVVTEDLPADCVAVGIPARVIRYRGVDVSSVE
jgi:acetyltransferase-like isoleucine patch superfamily enzyme